MANYHKSGVLYGAHNQGHVKLPYCYVGIKGKNHVAMVDVGYNDKAYGKTLGDRFGVENWRSPREVLAEIGLTPEDVDIVFITHAHFDHFGNVEDFPKAKFYIQEREVSKWVWAMSLPERMRWMMTAVEPGDIVRGGRVGARSSPCHHRRRASKRTAGDRPAPRARQPHLWLDVGYRPQ